MTTAILAVVLAGLFVAFWKMINPVRILSRGKCRLWDEDVIDAAKAKRRHRCLRRIREDNPRLVGS